MSCLKWVKVRAACFSLVVLSLSVRFGKLNLGSCLFIPCAILLEGVIRGVSSSTNPKKDHSVIHGQPRLGKSLAEYGSRPLLLVGAFDLSFQGLGSIRGPRFGFRRTLGKCRR